MKTYDFELVLNKATTDEDDERLFERFEGRVSPAVVGGAPLLYVHIEASSMEDAIRDAVAGTEEVGLSIRRIELDPKSILDDAA